ncbi:Rha family transcriptional regulator [Aeromonas veronii]|uniref:Rha family transcriptional regulator n=1 Tax=Aeromonas veronii TaxID=654 RepID=UPI0027DD79BD|nr:Rha family transcriptional regulator [Aeromonas veronii]WMJ06208.1 Rha family transcriptional regulator [Aeromonas veronii]
MFEVTANTVEDQLDEGVFRALVSVKGDQVVTNSRIIADIFGKSHKNVLRAIRQLPCSEVFSRRNFEPTDFIDKNGDIQPQYLITRNGCVFLIMGFTGAKAGAFKEAFINAFDWMETMIRKRDELNRRINDHTLRAMDSANEGSVHGRGLAKRRVDKRTLALEEFQLRGEAQHSLSLTLGAQ